MKKQRILIVDDQAGFTRRVRVNLEREGYEVREENHALSAMATAREFRPDVVLLDVMMSGMDGGDVAAALQKDPRLQGIPIIFVTAAVPRREAGSGELVSGGHLFLPKPVGLHELLKAIEESLSNKK